MGLGAQLRERREGKGLGLREVAAAAGVTHGYLSQLEREAITQPAPAILHKLSIGYDEPFDLLMRWAGYIESSPLSPNQERALRYMGEDLSDDELQAIRAVLNAIRGRRAGLSFKSLDAPLTAHEVQLLRRHAEALLRQAGAFGVVPTPVDELLRVSKLVAADEIYLDVEEKRRLRSIFGDLVDTVLTRLQGVIHFRSREVWTNPDHNEQRRRFVVCHEIGHNVLPWHRGLFAYLDDNERLRADHAVQFEREANQAAIELLAQGDRLRAEADDSQLTFAQIANLSVRYGISLQATARRVVEESRHEYALIIAYRGSLTGKLMPHLYCSPSFDERFRWLGKTVKHPEFHELLSDTNGVIDVPIGTMDLSGKPVFLARQILETRRAKLFLFAPPRNRILRFGSLGRANSRTA